jgi:hypothetical protein
MPEKHGSGQRTHAAWQERERHREGAASIYKTWLLGAVHVCVPFFQGEYISGPLYSHIYRYILLVLDLNSFIRKEPFFAKKKITFATCLL